MTESTRKQRLALEVRDIVEQLSGKDVPSEAVGQSFYDLGLDSLLLTQAAQAIGRRFKVQLKLRHLVEDFPSCQLLADYLDGVVAPDAVPADEAPTPAAPPAATPATTTPQPAPAVPPLPQLSAELLSRPANGFVESVVQQQLALMAQQIQVLAGGGVSVAAAPSAAPPAPITPEARPLAAVEPAAPVASQQEAEVAARPHGPQLVIDRAQSSALSPKQEAHIDRLIERYSRKTAKSKAFTARNRPNIADPRTVAGFKPRLKEMVYPIVAERSSGCRIWDLDGNEYIDLLSGYGSNFFGFGAPFVRQAIAEQMERGMEIGPQTHLVEEVATLFKQSVFADRVAFCNTGSEAVLATLRLARTTTGRDLVVMFTGGYHGIFDEVVVRPTKRGSVPAAPGIPPGSVENMLVLPWASEEALEVLRQRADEIAAVLVEPVQSRAPDIQPVEFLRAVREITEKSGAALIFDEVVTGFRVAPGGAQEYFGIRADLASYGKVVGGGLSIGVVAGRREFMDALDGGLWSYGDESTPEVGVTYFAGTFVRHPLHLAAARAVLLHLQKEGPELQRKVNAETTHFVRDVNAALGRLGVPVALHHFSSVMKIAHTEETPFSELLFAHLRERGVHVWAGRPCFLTVAHGKKELARVTSAFESAAEEMQDAKFYPRPPGRKRTAKPPVAGARLGRDPQGNPRWYVADPNDASRYHLA